MENQTLTKEYEDFPVISNTQSFSKAVHRRYGEYTRAQKLKLKIGSWNTAARLGTENDLASWFAQEKSYIAHPSILDNDGVYDTKQTQVTLVASQNDEIGILENTHNHDNYEESEDQEQVGIYVLGLQEITGLTTAREYIGRIYTDTEPISRWRKALEKALPSDYLQIMEQQLSGLLLFIYASPSIAPKISSVSTVSVGTSMIGYFGNKGAIATRIVLAETTRITFINSHLPSGAEPQQLERRFGDIDQILQKVAFEPVSLHGLQVDSQERIGDEDFIFWFGDLNFRLDGLPGDEIRRLLMLMTKGENVTDSTSKDSNEEEIKEDETFVIHSESDDEDNEENENNVGPREAIGEFKAEISSSPNSLESEYVDYDPSQDPASLQATLNCLLPHDQLKCAQKNKRIFHDGWKEGSISFLPTYKYDVGGKRDFDSSEKKRAPSWCDRILYRTRQDKEEFEKKQKKDQALSTKKGKDIDIGEKDDLENDKEVHYDYNPEEDGFKKNGYDLYEESENFDSEDKIRLDVYTSHQEVVSSDHKPIHATFTLSYDVILPDLKTKVQQEVVRDLDRAENERRPGVTVVIDHCIDNSLGESFIEANDVVDFGPVAFNQRKIRTLTIANTSRVPSTVTFADKNSVTGKGESDSPQWLSIYLTSSKVDENTMKMMRSSITLEPGDAINATLELMVQDIELVRALNENLCYLEDILVLRVTDGRDHFIPVRGSWLQTCLGRSIDQLLEVPECGARTLSSRKGYSTMNTAGQDFNSSAPRELYRLTETIQLLLERVIADSNILEDSSIPENAPGWPFDSKHWIYKDSQMHDLYIQLVVEALDTGQNLNNVFAPETLAKGKLEIICEVLLIFLSYLSDGIITHDIWTILEANYADRGSSPEEIKTWTLDILSATPNHNISFVFLTSMLAQVIAELAPISCNRNSCTGSYKSPFTRSSSVAAIDLVLRKSISWRARPSSTLPQTLITPPSSHSDPQFLNRELVLKSMTEIFVPIIFRDVVGMKEREKKSIQAKRKIILQSFLIL